jgi:hypothetical protein
MVYSERDSKGEGVCGLASESRCRSRCVRCGELEVSWQRLAFTSKGLWATTWAWAIREHRLQHDFLRRSDADCNGLTESKLAYNAIRCCPVQY